MGLGALQHICRGLLEAGMAPGTPAAVIENGTLPRQRRVAATLERMPDEAARHAVSSPAILVVGAVCGLAERFDWTGFLPLWGREILVVSSQATGRGLAERLREKGCGVDEMCGIEMEALPQPEGFWRGLPAYDWIVMTSDFGARLFAEGLLQNDVDVRAFSKTRFAVVGSRTAAALRRIGIIADYVPMSFTARCLAEGLAPLITRGDRVLQYRAREGSGDVAAMLREKGADYEEVAAYATRRRDVADDAVRRRLAASAYAAVTFTSGSAVDAFAAGMDGLDFSRMRAVCIGEVTAAAAAKLGLRTETSPEATLDSMTAYIVEKIGK